MYRNIIIAILLILAILIGAFLIWPNYQRLKNLQIQIERTKTSLQESERYYNELTLTLQRLKEFEPELSKIEMALPSYTSMPSFYNFIEKTSRENGLILRKVDSNPAKDSVIKPEIKEIGVSASLSGTYSSLKNFLVAIEKNSRMIEIDKISFSPPGKGDIFDFNINFKIYSY